MIADLLQRGAVGMPDAGADEDLAGLEVEVEARGVGVLARLVAELDAGVGLVGALVLGEAHVAVDAEERAADRPRIGVEVGADLGQARPEIADELLRRMAQLLLVALLVGLEPLAVVVGLEVAQELEELRAEVGSGGHGRPLDR